MVAYSNLWIFFFFNFVCIGQMNLPCGQNGVLGQGNYQSLSTSLITSCPMSWNLNLSFLDVRFPLVSFFCYHRCIHFLVSVIDWKQIYFLYLSYLKFLFLFIYLFLNFGACYFSLEMCMLGSSTLLESSNGFIR